VKLLVSCGIRWISTRYVLNNLLFLVVDIWFVGDDLNFTFVQPHGVLLIKWHQPKKSISKLMACLPYAPGEDAVSMDPYLALACLASTSYLNTWIGGEDFSCESFLFHSLVNMNPSSIAKFMLDIKYFFAAYFILACHCVVFD
jgi:hypothetical protein